MRAKPTPKDFSLSQEDIERIGRIEAVVSDKEIGCSWMENLLPKRGGFFAGLISIVIFSVLGPIFFLGIIASPIIQFFASIRLSLDPKSKNFDAYRFALHEFEKANQQVSPLKSSSNELSLVGRSVVQPRVQESESKPDSADSLPPADPPYIPPAGWNPTPSNPFLHEGLRLDTEKPLSGETQADAGSITPSKASKPRKARNPRPKKEPAIKEDLLPDHFSEGAARQVTLTTYERDPRARRACLDHHGFSCNVCGTNLEEKYGELGKDFIHVHHLRPLSEISENYEVNPIRDLIPVCPTCHAILHRKTPPLTPDEVRQLLINQGRLKTPSETSAIKKRKPQPAKATVIKQPRAVSAKKPKGQFPEKLAVEQLKPEATMSYEERVPTDRLPKMTEAVKSLIAAGVTSPELVADTLDKLNPRSRKFSDHFWELFCEVDPSLCRSVDWQAIYQAKDAKAR